VVFNTEGDSSFWLSKVIIYIAKGDTPLESPFQRGYTPLISIFPFPTGEGGQACPLASAEALAQAGRARLWQAGGWVDNNLFSA
jgi:hypothetical protein